MARYLFTCFEFDSEARSLTKDGELVRLRAKTLKLLTLFLENAGVDLPREQIIAQVWDLQYVSNEVLSQTIFELRKALAGCERAPKFIQSVKGVGYRWDDGGEMTVIPTVPKPEPSAEGLSETTDAETTGVPTRSDAETADPTAEADAQSRRYALKMTAVACFLLALVGYLGVSWFNIAREKALRDLATWSLILAPLKNETGDPSLNWMTDAFTNYWACQVEDRFPFPIERSNSGAPFAPSSPDQLLIQPKLVREDAVYILHCTVTGQGRSRSFSLEDKNLMRLVRHFGEKLGDNFVGRRAPEKRPSKADLALFERGLEAWAKKDHHRAVLHFEELLLKGVRIEWARLLLADSLVALERHRHAAPLFLEGFSEGQLNSGLGQIQFSCKGLVTCAESKGYYNEAAMWREQSIRLGEQLGRPGTFREKLAWAQALVACGQPKQAAAVYQELLATPRSQEQTAQLEGLLKSLGQQSATSKPLQPAD